MRPPVSDGFGNVTGNVTGNVSGIAITLYRTLLWMSTFFV
jgi:hypothetical protein